jgi:hypothetical protein
VPEDFFSGVDQLEAEIAGVRGKTPTFYRDARCFTLLLPARLLALRRLLPDPRFVPAQVFPGIGAVNLTAFEYHDTDIGPYNEFSVSILLNSSQFLQIPGYNAIRQLVRNCFCAYIHHLPVTTEEALGGGIQLYNYPKFMASIDFSDTEEWVTCELATGGDLICRTKGRKIPATRSGTMKYICHLYQYQQPQYAEMKVNARRYRMAMAQGNAELELGAEHPVARELASLLISKKPLAYIYVPSMQAILYGPEHISLAQVAFFLERGFGISFKDLADLTKSKKKKE